MAEEKKEEIIKNYCTVCGTENNTDSAYCNRCGALLSPETADSKINESKIIPRTIELVLGILGGIFGLIGGIVTLSVELSSSIALSYGISALIASIVGIIGAVVVVKYPLRGGIVLIVSGVWLFISNSAYGDFGTFLFVLAGLLAIIRK
jgi:zinc-ribbon domain